jgi:hypothetical protein
MYNFKYKINEHQRFNTYELYVTADKKNSHFYQKIRNSLFFILLILTAFIIGAFIHKSYQKYQRDFHLQEIQIKEMKASRLDDQQKRSHLKLTQAITNSVVNNLQANRDVKTMNYNELKLIIKKVVTRIQETPNTTEEI